jgi:hypothetical protein
MGKSVVGGGVAPPRCRIASREGKVIGLCMQREIGGHGKVRARAETLAYGARDTRTLLTRSLMVGEQYGFFTEC